MDLTDRLMPAFASPTGMPYQYVNLHTGAVSGNTPPLAEIGTNILEFGVLSRDHRRPEVLQRGEEGLPVAVAKRSSLNLMGTYLNVETGDWADSTRPGTEPAGRLVLRVPVGRLGTARRPGLPATGSRCSTTR